jgi:hypothetical protein
MMRELGARLYGRLWLCGACVVRGWPTTIGGSTSIAFSRQGSPMRSSLASR